MTSGTEIRCRNVRARFERVCRGVLPGIRVLPARKAAKLHFLEEEIGRIEAACAEIPAEMDRLREAARKEGADAGYHEGCSDARGLVAEALRFRAETREVLSAGAIELAFSIAQRLIERELERDPAVFAGLVEKWRREACASAACTIHLSPADAAALDAEAAPLDGAFVVADPSLPRGACRIEAGDDMFDAGLDARLGALRDAVD